MKKVIGLLFGCLMLSEFAFSQDIDINDSTAMTPTVCLAEKGHMISVNVLQFAVGTANINYECHFTPQTSIKLGVGCQTGSRLTTKGQQAGVAGGLYGMVQPRYYFKKASENCFIQYGLALSYKYWSYDAKYDITKDLQAQYPLKDDYDENVAKLKNDSNYDVQKDGSVYEIKPEVEHLGGLSLFGKGCIAGGFTIELEAGFGLGTKAEKFYATPNLGFSFGWTFGAKKE
ncbi:MAG: hypothetical protein J6X43_09710 [Bacteroidales bacterium]|nr:hypothetical protein [Bacteroidales bacterium]